MSNGLTHSILTDGNIRQYLRLLKSEWQAVYTEVKRRCHAEKRVTPSRNCVLRRIRALDARLVARKRLGTKSAESIALSTPGMLEATEALELIQIDHTLADVMIVDSVYRRSIGRSWLSLAIDVATRSVLGFHLELEAPSALAVAVAVALCIEHTVLPKIRSAAAPTTACRAKRWTKIGAAFPHKDGIGFNIELKAFPVDGRLVVLPPDGDDERNGK